MNINQTIELIKELHADQLDKTGDPYWTHPVAVMASLPSNVTDEDRQIALLHDVAEDCFGKLSGKGLYTGSTAFLLEHGFSRYVVSGVLLLTRKNGTFITSVSSDGMGNAPYCLTENFSIKKGTYTEYVQNIIWHRHFGALITKLHDNKHNTNSERLARISDEKVRQQFFDMRDGRYARARELLEKELTNWKDRTRI